MQTVETIDMSTVIKYQVHDGYDNFTSRVGLNSNNTLSAGLYTLNPITRNRIQLEAAYRGSWIAGKVVDAVAEDMTRSGINIKTTTKDKDIAEFNKYIKHKGIWDSLCSGIKWGRLYGGAIAVIQIEGQKLDTPLRIDTVSKKQFQGLSVYDRWQLQPVLNKIIQYGPEMGLPEYYDLITLATTDNPIGMAASMPTGGIIRVHYSRIIRFIGIELPFFQAITEQMWGESLLERLWDRMISFDNATMSSANLIERANNRTVGINGLREIIAAGGRAQQGLESMFEMMRIFQTNEGLTLLDKEDDFKTSSYTFSGLSDILLQFGQQLGGACDIPLVRFFGQSPAGLSATGESDIRMYYDMINAQQNAKLRKGLEKLLAIMWRSRFGTDEPEDLDFEFTPLWQMSAMDQAEINSKNTTSVLAAEAGGLIDRATGMKELRQMSGDNGLFSNITDEMVAEAESDPIAPLPEETELPKEEDKNKKLSVGDKLKKWIMRTK